MGVPILRFLKAPARIIEKAPSAGLFDGQTDEDEMGFTYKMLDACLMGQEVPPDVKERIDRMHRRSEHKRAAITVFQK